MFTTYCFSIHTSKRRRASSRHYHSHLTWYSIKSRNLSSAARSRSRRTLPSPVSVLRLAGDGASRSTSTSSCAIARASSLSGGGVDDDDMVEVWWVTTRELSGEWQHSQDQTRRVSLCHCPAPACHLTSRWILPRGRESTLSTRTFNGAACSDTFEQSCSHQPGRHTGHDYDEE